MTTTTLGKLVASPQVLAALARLRATAEAPAPAANPPKTAQPPAPAKPAPAPHPAAQEKAAAATAAARQEANRARRAEANDLVAVLRARWPLAFAMPRPPLAIGIDKEIRAALGEAIDQATLRLAIGSWVQRVDSRGCGPRRAAAQSRRHARGPAVRGCAPECGGAAAADRRAHKKRDRGLARTRGKRPRPLRLSIGVEV